MVSLALALLPGPVRAAPLGPVVFAVQLGTSDGQFAIEISSTAPLRYTAVENRAEPFTLTLSLPGAALAFPPSTRDVREIPLRQVIASVIGQDEGRQARLDLVFDRVVPYRIVQDRRRLLVLVAAVGVPTRVVLRGRLSASGEPLPADEMPVASPEPAVSKSFPPPLAGSPAPRLAVPAKSPPPARPPIPSDVPSPAQSPVAVAAPATPPVEPGTPPPPPILLEAPVGRVPLVAARPARLIRVLRLSLAATSPETQVRIHADGALPKPRTFTLPSPNRLVVDFDGAAFAMTETTLAVESALVEQARASRFRAVPLEVVRVVLDLKQPAPYWIETRPDGVVVHVGSSGPAP